MRNGRGMCRTNGRRKEEYKQTNWSASMKKRGGDESAFFKRKICKSWNKSSDRSERKEDKKEKEALVAVMTRFL
ncbi:unnamed protein product [Caenorhabditis sp. 36 PRJEB53466]|nr:unnamed protein product [Caenorhabditis sp. 36 PRJEB53466]